MHLGHYGAVGIGRANNNNNHKNGNNGGNNKNNNGGGGGVGFTCAGPPSMSFEEFISIHGRPKQRQQQQQQPPPMPVQRLQQPDPNMYQPARFYPHAGGPIPLPRTLDQIDYSEYVRK